MDPEDFPDDPDFLVLLIDDLLEPVDFLDEPERSMLFGDDPLEDPVLLLIELLDGLSELPRLESPVDFRESLPLLR